MTIKADDVTGVTGIVVVNVGISTWPNGCNRGEQRSELAARCGDVGDVKQFD